jgi:hypothetical protein
MSDQDRVKINWMDNIDSECLARAGAKSSPYPRIARLPTTTGGNQFGIGGTDELEQAERMKR